MSLRYLIILLLLVASSKAATVDDLSFTLNEDGTELGVSYCDRLATGSLVIPSTYDGYPVTSIVNGAFFNCANLTSVTIPESVTLIRRQAFNFCTNLTSINLPNNLTRIGGSAFANCPNLAPLAIPDSVIAVGAEATNIPVTYIDEIGYIFSENRVNAYVVDFSNVTSSEVVVPATIDGATVRSVTGNHDNSSIFTFLPNNTVITSLTLPDTLAYIGDYGFLYYTSLTTINLPESLTSLGFMTFAGCSSLTSLNIPENLTAIDTSTFVKCSSLNEITASANNNVYKSLENSLYDKTVTTLVRSRADVTDISLPSTVTTIGGNAYYGCLGLINITIPDSISTIGNYAFDHCSNLTSATFPDGTTSIAEGVFQHCTSLINFTIPESVTSIGGDAFKNCTSLSSISIPDSVTSIVGDAFFSCSKLSYIRFAATTAPAILSFRWTGSLTPFNGVAAQSIFIPAGSAQSYLDAGDGSKYSGLAVVEPSILQSLANMIEISIETDISTGEVSLPLVVAYNESGEYTILDISTGESFVAGSWAWDPIAQAAYFGGNLTIDLWDYQFEGFMNSYVYPYTATIYRDPDNPGVATATAIGIYYDGFTDLDNNGKLDIFQIRDGDSFPDSSFTIGLADLLSLNSSYIPESVLSLWTNVARGKVIEYKSYKSINLNDWELFDTKLVPYDTDQDQVFIKSEINISD